MKKLFKRYWLIGLLVLVGVGMLWGSSILVNKIGDSPTPTPTEGGMLGGVTRTKIGAQTAWTTSLIPSASFTVNLGSSALPVNQLFFTRASGSFSEFTSYASASVYYFSDGTGPLPAIALADEKTTGFFSAQANDISITIAGTRRFAFVGSDFYTIGGGSIRMGASSDNILSPGGAGVLVIGSPNAASPVSQTIRAQGSRSGTDSNVSGGNLTLQAGPGTGSSVGSSLFFQAPVPVGSGSGAQTQTTILTVSASGASVSTNFETVGYASISGKLTQVSVASNSFGGSLSGPTTGTLSVGTSNNPLKILWSNIVKAVNSLNIPAWTTTLTTSGDIANKVASASSGASLRAHDGTAERVISARPCYTYAYETPTSTDHFGDMIFDDPMTIAKVTATASGSNAVGWNLQYGARGAVTTNVFTTSKSASSSADGTYTTFANSAISDGQHFHLVISSSSATIEELDVTVCMYKTP